MSTAAVGSPRPRLAWELKPGALPLGGLFGLFTALGCALVSLLGLDHLGVTLCVFRLATGLPCPTCGTTRVFGRLGRFDVAGALAMNPLAALGALALLAWGLADLVLLPTRQALRVAPPAAWRDGLRIAAVGALLLNWAFLIAVQR